MVRTNESELLKLLNNRKAWEGGEFKPPVLGPAYIAASAKAEACIQRVDNSDPFAAPRARMFMLRGIELPSDMAKDCHSREALRRKEKIVADDALVAAKETAQAKQKKIDADKAWNQFHAAEYKARYGSKKN